MASFFLSLHHRQRVESILAVTRSQLHTWSRSRGNKYPSPPDLAVALYASTAASKDGARLASRRLRIRRCREGTTAAESRASDEFSQTRATIADQRWIGIRYARATSSISAWCAAGNLPMGSRGRIVTADLFCISNSSNDKSARMPRQTRLTARGGALFVLGEISSRTVRNKGLLEETLCRCGKPDALDRRISWRCANRRQCRHWTRTPELADGNRTTPSGCRIRTTISARSLGIRPASICPAIVRCDRRRRS